jgi:hypothetical protein
VCRWRTRDDGSHDPNIRTIIKPLLNLFHGERGGKRWKNAVDIALRTLHPKTVTELIEVRAAQHSSSQSYGMGPSLCDTHIVCAWCLGITDKLQKQFPESLAKGQVAYWRKSCSLFVLWIIW